MLRDDCSSSTVSVFNNNPDHPEFYEHQTNKPEHRERVHNPEYYEKANSQQGGGKRKFEDRMTLTEAKVGDFQDSRDYVDFLQSKLQGINIKIVK